MTRESIDELRKRLLNDEGVREMIRMRAYELYLIRGDMPGHEAEDWFRAEYEVIAFFIDQDSGSASQIAPDSSETGGLATASEQPVAEATATEALSDAAVEKKQEKKPRKVPSSSSTRRKKTASEAGNEGEEGSEKKKAGKRSSGAKSVEGTAKPRKTKSS
ncbi:MAG TPA: DUF2934 domain-containing protein [Blastocatellia bacterium]|nr:DUF2934 domain-containing protein [Blastocatellia bacterium]